MKKKIRFSTISIGSEPDMPDINDLMTFVQTYRGCEVDIISFHLIQSLAAQKTGRISSLCAGGRYYLPRLESAITYRPDSCFADSTEVVADGMLINRFAGPVRVATPAPHQYEGSPEEKDEEKYADFCDAFAKILRDMRDTGISGHILHALKVHPIEIERLISKKTGIIAPDGDEEMQGHLLEYQQSITLNNSRLSLLPVLFDHYEIREIIIINPDETGLKTAMDYADPDQIKAGGYGKGQETEYWNRIGKNAEISIEADW